MMDIRPYFKAFLRHTNQNIRKVRGKALTVSAFGQTDVGLLRKNNEDAFCMFLWPECNCTEELEFSDEKIFIAIVSDGMGGANAGEVASEMSIDGIREAFLNLKEVSDIEELKVFLAKTVVDVHYTIVEAAERDIEKSGMGATLSLLAIYKETAVMVQVGDSRIYRLRDDLLEQMTKDQSLVAELVEQRIITAKEALNHPQRNVIKQAMGMIDKSLRPVVSTANIQSGDEWLLCSDGLTDGVYGDLLRKILLRNRQQNKLSESCEDLIQQANEKSGKDNSTIILVRVR